MTDLASEVAQLARALAAAKPAGTFLCLGSGLREVAARMLEGMDHASGLVVLVQDARERARLEREFEGDLRASVHRQDPASFFSDVRAHRFDLIVDRIADEHRGALRLGLGLLRAGGVYLASGLDGPSREALSGRAQQSEPALSDPDEFEVARLGDRTESLMVVRRAERRRAKRRPKPRAR